MRMLLVRAWALIAGWRCGGCGTRYRWRTACEPCCTRVVGLALDRALAQATAAVDAEIAKKRAIVVVHSRKVPLNAGRWN